MLVLHGTWLPAGTAVKDRGYFFVWGEMVPGTEFPDAVLPRRRGRRPRGWHPGQAEMADLHHGLALKQVPETIRLWLLLPTSGGRPQFSPLVPVTGTPDDANGEVTLAPWLVEGFLLSVGQAVELLLYKRFSFEAVLPAAEWHFWRRVALWAMELLARQRFIPMLDEKTYQAVWRPVFNAAEDMHRLELLARSMPPACLAVAGLKNGASPGKEDSSILPAPGAMLMDFVRCMVQEKISGWLASMPAARFEGIRSQAGARWVEALRRGGGPVDLPEEVLKTMAGELIAWRSPVSRRQASFRTCFRLEPPPEPEEKDVRDPDAGEDETWTLRFFLQAVDDPSLLVPAEAVWKERSSTLHFLRRRFENPQERLLADLGQACRLFPPLIKALDTPCPTHCLLSTAQAYTFLKQAVPLLKESGLGVQVPAWWSGEGTSAGLGLRLKLRQSSKGLSKGVGRGIISLHTLVEFNWELALGEETISAAEFQKLAAMKVPLMRVKGRWVEIDPAQMEKALNLVAGKGKKFSLTLGEAMRLAAGIPSGSAPDPGDLPVTGIDAEGELARVLEELQEESKLTLLPTPESFRGQLRPYQVRGFSWMVFLSRMGMGGCLADDMGLGKTIQFLAFLLHRVEQGLSQGPALLVCPTSVVGNWQREAARFAPRLRVLVHHGPNRLQGKDFIREAKASHLVLTTYALAQRDGRLLASVEWDGVVLDEAQNIKNPGAKQTRSVKRLKCGYRFALTGTPVENRLSELWSIMDFLNPGFLGPAADFNRRFAVPIERYGHREKTRRLQQLVRPFILRRVKTDPRIIQDLPEKQESNVYCNLTREQATLYEAVVREMLERIEGAEGMERRGLVLAATTRLKQICNHPAQFLADGILEPKRSGKMMRLLELLEEILDGGEKALIFTQFARMGEILKNQLQVRFGREVLFLYGGVGQRQRDRMVERFQQRSGPALFVISLKAGGVGLNLTRANHVFHFDRWWNPAVEDQATDRAFRIGQKKNVFVYKFICSGTLEEKIDRLITEKKNLAGSIITTAEEWLTEMSTDELRELFTLSRQAVDED
ncbi:DEAD/DEAH box helicase [Calderihabitans maritimus]|uniref:SNF2-like protein n=1 Tax=Calderihabitans maritimus TaxID=1246530 RepID=A0A1Z5HQA6_9FIRM|nr:DEAD/DEAH box helicase [Calderihabitans maritimus]GAW91709.1 SNF2-like protein [Calderihabitans maritimus]